LDSLSLDRHQESVPNSPQLPVLSVSNSTLA